jgi:hypothetical protein
MDYKKSIINLLISLLLSPVIVYLVLMLAKLAGSTYEMTNGETFIIWLLMAIVVNQSIVKKE